MEKIVEELFDKLNNEITKYNPYYNKDLINWAFLFAYEAHKWVFRKSWEPYIIHPLNTAINLTRIEADEDSIIWAILHDVCDNSEYSLSDIEKNFWQDVRKLVEWVIKLWELYYKTEMSKEEVDTLRKSLVSVWEDIRIFLIKIADRLHNLETLEFLPKSKRYRIAKETEQIYIPIINFLSIWEFMTEFHDLCFKYEDEKEYKKLFKIFGKNQESYERAIIEANNILEKELKKEKIDFKITSRVKSLYSIHKKMKQKNLDVNEIADVLALRIITNKVQDCYKILWITHKIFKVKNEKFKDYISNPKENWYQSIHTTVYDNNSNLIEIQIQTYDMWKLNKSWLAAHFLYKWFWIEYWNMPSWMKWVLNIQKKSIDTKWFLEKLKDEVIVSDIKCMNYDWKIILLPKNSTLIDFAFEIWDKEWTNFESAVVNWNYIDDPFYKLKHLDYIKIKSWNKVNFDYKVESVSLVKTLKAREKLKEMFNKYSKNKTEDLWRFLINNELEVYSLKHFDNLPSKIKKASIKNFWLKDENQLYLFLWLWILDVKKVFDFIASFFDKNDFYNEVSLKIFTKTNDFTSINNIVNILYNLNIKTNKLNFKDKKNSISLNVSIDSTKELDNLLKELNRAPNVLNVIRVFPMRLKIYYLLFFISIISLSWLVLFINLVDVNQTRFFIIKWIFFGSIIFMIFILSFLKYIVKKMLPDVLKYKRFWLSIFLLNTLILWVVFWELYHLWFYFDLFLYWIFWSVMYWALMFEYFNFRKKIIKNKKL